MQFDVLKFEGAPAVLAVRIAKRYQRHIRRCAHLCIETAVETRQENWPRARILRDRSDMHEEMACEYGYLLGYTSDETDDFVNHEIKAAAPEGLNVEYW